MSLSGHSYAEIHVRPSTFFTRIQLSKIHQQFFHLSASELFNLIQRKLQEYKTTEIRKVMKEKHKKLRRGLSLLLEQNITGSMNG